jgi:hypothetical protein
MYESRQEFIDTVPVSEQCRQQRKASPKDARTLDEHRTAPLLQFMKVISGHIADSPQTLGTCFIAHALGIHEQVAPIRFTPTQGI